VQLRSTGSLLNEQRNCRYFWTRTGGTAADRPCRADPLLPPLDTTLDILRFAAALSSGSSDLLQFQPASSGTGQQRSFVLRIGLPISGHSVSSIRRLVAKWVWPMSRRYVKGCARWPPAPRSNTPCGRSWVAFSEKHCAWTRRSTARIASCSAGRVSRGSSTTAASWLNVPRVHTCCYLANGPGAVLQEVLRQEAHT
jgi:hypothetical protein